MKIKKNIFYVKNLKFLSKQPAVEDYLKTKIKPIHYKNK